MLVGGSTENVKLIDFGIAKLVGEAALEVGGGKLTRTGAIFGTPAYMSPEQALGRAIDARVDLYALGAILFEMLTGRVPFDSTDTLALLRMQISSAPPRLADLGLALPDEIEQLVARALEKGPEARFASAEAMLAALDSAATWLY